MRSFALAVLCVAIISSVLSAENNQRYPTKYNNFDIDSVLNNEKILKNYVNCLVGEGNCTPQGRDLAKYLPDAIRTECSKCDEKQKDTAVRVLRFLDEKHPDLLKRLLRKFDPDQEYEMKFRERLLGKSAKASTPAKASNATQHQHHHHH